MPWSRVACIQTGVNGIKWAALVLMTFDHINAYLLAYAQPWMFNAGRLSLPLFAIALGLNMAQLGKHEGALARLRTASRLAAVGLLAAPVHTALNVAPMWGWWPLNVMFTLHAAVCVVHALESKTPWGPSIAVITWVVAGFVAEYAWPGVALAVSVWGYQRKPSWLTVAGFVVSLYGVCLVSGNSWAWSAVPVAACLLTAPIRWPRAQWFFYGFYPTHLYVLWVARAFVWPVA